MKRNQEAVSPVIGVILMVAITVVLAAILYVWASSFIGTAKATPKAEFIPHHYGDDYQFTLRGLTKPVAVFDITYHLLDPNGQTIWSDGLEIIYGLRNDKVGGNYVNSHWRITFLDNDNPQDGLMGNNDQFVIRGSRNVDNDPIWTNEDRTKFPAEIVGVSGYQLKLVFEPTGHPIVEKKIP